MMGMPRPATSAPRRMTPKEVAQLPEGAAPPADPATEAKPEPQAKPEQPAKPESKETPPTESPAEKAKPADPQDGGAAPAEPDTELVAVGDILGDVVSVEFDGVPLREVLEHLAHIRKFEVVLHQSLVRDAAALDQPVTLKSRQLSLEQVLDQTLLPSDLEWNLEGPVLLVGMAGDMDSRMETHAYGVHELLDREEASELIETIEQTVQPDSWMAVGGSGQIKVFGQQLIVRQTQRAHRELEMFIANVKEQAAAADEQQAQNPDKAKRLVTAVYSVEEKSAAELRNAVTMLVGPSCWEEDNVVITVVGSKLLVRQTPAVQREVARLLKKIEVGPSPGPFGSPIPQTRGGGFGGGGGGALGGGVGGMGGGGGGFFQHRANESQPVEKKADSSSAVSGNDSVGALAQVREKATPVQSSQKEAAPVVPVEDVLGDVVPVDFDGTSIRDVLESLARQKKFEVIYHQKLVHKPDELDSQIILKSRLMTLRQILNHVLDPNELGWKIDGAVLVVGDKEDVDSHNIFQTRYYEIGDLLEQFGDAQLIRQQITQRVDLESWEDVGGAGSAEVIGSTLIVRQSDDVHQKLKPFLEKLRSIATAESGVVSDTSQRDQLTTRTYYLDEKSATKLQSAIPQVVKSDLWQSEGGIAAAGSTLIVTQAPALQVQVGRIVAAVKLHDELVLLSKNAPTGAKLSGIMCNPLGCHPAEKSAAETSTSK